MITFKSKEESEVWCNFVYALLQSSRTVEVGFPESADQFIEEFRKRMEPEQPKKNCECIAGELCDKCF